MSERTFRHWLQFLIGWALCFAVRLLPYRPANVEPVMTTMMPFAKRFGVLGSVFFVVCNFLLYDALTSGIGVWTFVTAGAYAVVAMGAAWYFRTRSGALHYAVYAAIGTIIFDALTGLTVGPIVYDQPFLEALTGQIPFTLRHLLFNVLLGFFVSPLIEKWIVSNSTLEWMPRFLQQDR